MTKIRIPPTLREQTGGEREVAAEGETVRDLLDDLTSRFPTLQEQLPFVNVYVEGEDVRTLDGVETEVKPDSTVILLPAMAGGVSRLSAKRTRGRGLGEPEGSPS